MVGPDVEETRLFLSKNLDKMTSNDVMATGYRTYTKQVVCHNLNSIVIIQLQNITTRKLKYTTKIKKQLLTEMLRCALFLQERKLSWVALTLVFLLVSKKIDTFSWHTVDNNGHFTSRMTFEVCISWSIVYNLHTNETCNVFFNNIIFNFVSVCFLLTEFRVKTTQSATPLYFALRRLKQWNQVSSIEKIRGKWLLRDNLLSN